MHGGDRLRVVGLPQRVPELIALDLPVLRVGGLLDLRGLEFTAAGFGALIEAVNWVGSLFYGGTLGVFVLAFFVKRCTATGAFVGVLAGEAAIFTTARFTAAFLWFNVVGCLVVVAVGWSISAPARR